MTSYCSMGLIHETAESRPETATLERGWLEDAETQSGDAGDLLRLGQERDRADDVRRRQGVGRLARRLERTVVWSAVVLYVGTIALAFLDDVSLDPTFDLGTYLQRVIIVSIAGSPIWMLVMIPWRAF